MHPARFIMSEHDRADTTSLLEVSGSLTSRGPYEHSSFDYCSAKPEALLGHDGIEWDERLEEVKEAH
jgi:hypothetical protein